MILHSRAVIHPSLFWRPSVFAGVPAFAFKKLNYSLDIFGATFFSRFGLFFCLTVLLIVSLIYASDPKESEIVRSDVRGAVSLLCAFDVSLT